MILVGGPDEPVVARAQTILQRLEPVGILGGQFGRGYARGLRGLLHLLPVHVRTGQEADVEAVEPLNRASASAEMYS